MHVRARITMKILHITNALPRISGGSTFCVELCDNLLTLGHKVEIAICDPEQPDIYPSCQHVPLIPIKSLFESKSDCLFDIVHIHGLWQPVLHKAGVWADNQGSPILWSPHGMLAPWAIKHKWWKKCLPWYLYQRHDLRRATCFHATSDLEVQWIRERGFNQSCCVVPLGTHLPDLQNKLENDRNPLFSRRAEKKLALFVGRIYPVKNLGTLIRAFAEARRKMNAADWRLILAGPDQAGHKSELVQLVRSLRLTVADLVNSHVDAVEFIRNEMDSDILFTGPVLGDQKDALYRCADIFVLPSHTENFAGVVVDALAFGVPVMVSDKTPWREVDEIRCGMVCPTSIEGMTHVLLKMMVLTDAERREMGQKGRSFVERKYTWAAVAGKMLDVYSRVLKILV